MSAFLSWLGVWLLAAGWLSLVNFFLPSDERSWVFVGAGLLLFVLAAWRERAVLGSRRADPWLYLLGLPLLAAAVVWPFPYRTGPLLCLGGLLLALPLLRAGSSRLRTWFRFLSVGLCLAGTVWIVQGGAVVGYWWFSARYHEAPFLTPLVHALTQVLGWDVGNSQGSLFLPSVAGMIQATTTWERLGLLPIMLLGAGGAVFASILERRDWRHFVRRVGAGIVLVVGYVLFRYLVLTAVLAISRDPVPFWLPLAMALTYLPLSLLLARFLPPDYGRLGGGLAARSKSGAKPRLRRRYAALAGLIFVAGLAVVGLFTFPDPGRQKAGRVLLDEYQSNWEWSTQTLDTEWYGQKSGYNYYSLGQWLKYYYQVDTNFEPRTPEILSAYDILIVKTPTAPFTPQEIEAIDAWVRDGGGLFLIGDHTNVFGTSSYLNPLARRFGLRFRYDSTYDLPTLRVTLYQPPGLLGHPITAEMPPFLFATSCTLQAPLLADNVMVGYGLRALPVDYARRVFFPDKERVNDYPFGLFLQSAAVRHGRGRVVAFTDSTVFSNFTMFIPGKPEYFLGVMNWLNHSERWPGMDGFLIGMALLAAVVGILVARPLDRRRATIVGLGALLLAASLGPWTSQRVAQVVYGLPEPHTDYTRIAFEGEHSRIALPTLPTAAPPGASFQTFYVWTQRLGYIPALVPTLEDAVTLGDVVVVVDPASPFEPSEVELVREFVAQGGRLLVLGDPLSQARQEEDSGQHLVNSLLVPFGLSLEARGVTTGVILDPDGEPLGQLSVTGVVVGGEPLLALEGQASVAALAQYGDGLVAAVAFSRPFSDREMGTTSTVPDAHQRFLYEIEFWLLRSLVEGRFLPPSLSGVPVLRALTGHNST